MSGKGRDDAGDILGGGGRKGEILVTFCEMPMEYDNFRQMRYDKIFYYYEREGGIYGENG